MMNTTTAAKFDSPNFPPSPPNDASSSIANKSDITYETVSQLDQDVSLRFQLRGGPGFGALSDPAMPLFGLAARLRKLAELPEEEVRALYQRVHDTINSITEELRRGGVDEITLRTYSYCLCAYLDEVAMLQPWGSPWMAHSLVSRFHGETFSGDKFFTILARLSQDARKNRDLLEFMYLCLVMGFRGKYKFGNDADEALNARKVELHRLLRQVRGPAPSLLADAGANVVDKPVRFTRQWPWWAPWPIGIALLGVIYAIYSWRLHRVTLEIQQALQQILPH